MKLAIGIVLGIVIGVVIMGLLGLRNDPADYLGDIEERDL